MQTMLELAQSLTVETKSWDYILEEWGWVLGGSAHGSVWRGGGYLAIKGAEPGVLSLTATGSTPGTATG